MVGVPGKYKGCETCRRRRVKCDNMRPTCRKCVSTGRRCEGYERQMVFITATPEDGGRCSSHPPRSTSKIHKTGTSSPKSVTSSSAGSNHSASPSPPTSATTPTYNMSHQMPLPSPPNSHSQGSSIMPSLAPSEPLSSAWDEMMFLTDKNAYYPTQIVSLQTRLSHVGRNVSGFVNPPHYELPDMRPISHDREFSVAGQCIVNIETDVRSPLGIPNNNSGLCAFLYEPNNCVGSPTDLSGWRSPEDYSTNVQNSGPRSFLAFPSHHFFSRVYRPTVISWSLLTRKSTHLANRDWSSTPWEYYPKHLTDRLLDTLAQLTGLLERSDAVALEVPTHARQLKSQELLSSCLYIERQLHEWCTLAAQTQDEQRRNSYFIERPADAQIPFTETFRFVDSATATAFLFYWMGNLLLGRCILQLHRLFFQPAIDYSMYPVLPANLNINLANYQQDRMYATNICCALDWALQATTQPDLLAGPLAVAEMYFREVQGQMELMWCEGFRRRMTTKGQNLSSVVTSKIWSEYGSF